jgi:hypothetical protein
MITAAKLLLANWKLVLIAVQLAALGWQTVRVASVKTELAEERQARATETSERNRAALRESERVAALQLAHAANQQEIVDVYTGIVQRLESGHAAAVADAQRVSRQLAARAARDREAARSDPVACERVADRSEVLAGVAGEGGELLEEALRIVRGRDAEVGLLLGLLRNDRTLLAPAGAAQIIRTTPP